MTKALHTAVLAAACLFMFGCASVMRPAASEQVPAPGPDKATVVFMRTSFVASAIGCDLFEVVDGKLHYIGQLPSGNKVAYETTSGDKVFMAYGTAADFMLAKLQGGKTYYSIVRPNWATGGFAPTPIRHQSPNDPTFGSQEFKNWTLRPSASSRPRRRPSGSRTTRRACRRSIPSIGAGSRTRATRRSTTGR